MAASDNPLLTMTDAITGHAGGEDVPDETFRDTALPGFRQVVTARRSIRVFDGEPIPDEVMRDCLRDATLAPSSSNLQPYELYWVRDPGARERLAEACLGQPAATTAGELVVVMARRDRWKTNLDKVWELMTQGGKITFPEPVDDYYHKITPRLRQTDALGLGNLMRRVLFWFQGPQRTDREEPGEHGRPSGVGPHPVLPRGHDLHAVADRPRLRLLSDRRPRQGPHPPTTRPPSPGRGHHGHRGGHPTTGRSLRKAGPAPLR